MAATLPKRFEVIGKYNNDDLSVAYYFIQDNEYQHWRMSQKAVSLHLTDYNNAIALARILNEEWTAFLRNPT